MKLGTLVSPEFKASFDKLNKAVVPTKTAFKMRGISKRVKECIDQYNEVKDSIILECGKLGEDGKPVVENNTIPISPDKIVVFYQKMKELSNLDEKLPEITVEDLGGDIGAVGLTPEDIYLLEFIVE